MVQESSCHVLLSNELRTAFVLLCCRVVDKGLETCVRGKILEPVDSQQKVQPIRDFTLVFLFPKELRGLWQELWVQLIRPSRCPHQWKDQITGTLVSISRI